MNPFASFSQIKKDHLLAPYTTFRVGGPADYFYDLVNLQELPGLVNEAHAHHIPVFFLGAGSNTLFHDRGFRGLVIHFCAAQVIVENTTIIAEAGAAIHVVVDAAKKASLSGMEVFTGLPGTVGGAVRGNAGCFGTEIKDVVTEVTLFSLEKDFFIKTTAEMDFGYRTSWIKDHPENTVCRVKFTLTPGDSTEISQKMTEIRAKRKTKQPSGPSAGSWFKNPEKGSAGQLIDAAGGKGLMVGGAKISSYHGNFFMNTGGATSADLLALSEKAKALVQAKFGISLETEIKIVPERI